MKALALAFLLLLATSSGAAATVCSPARVNDGEWWSYRIIDGKRCWYQGRPGRNKNLLSWGKQPIAATQQQARPVWVPRVAVIRPEVVEVPATPPRDLGAESIQPRVVKAETIRVVDGVLTSEALLAVAAKSRPEPQEPPQVSTPKQSRLPLAVPQPVEVTAPSGWWLALFPVLFIAASFFVIRFHPRQKGQPQWTSMTSYAEQSNRWPVGGRVTPQGRLARVRIIDQIGAGQLAPVPAPELVAAQYDFSNLGERIAESLVRAAEEQVTQATNNLERIKAFADNLRAEIAEKNAELIDMNVRLKEFGGTILDAHKKFHNAQEHQQERTSTMFEAQASSMTAEPQAIVDHQPDHAPERKRDWNTIAHSAPELRRDRNRLVGDGLSSERPVSEEP